MEAGWQHVINGSVPHVRSAVPPLQQALEQERHQRRARGDSATQTSVNPHMVDGKRLVRTGSAVGALSVPLQLQLPQQTPQEQRQRRLRVALNLCVQLSKVAGAMRAISGFAVRVHSALTL